MAEGDKNQWVIWSIVVGAIILTFVAFNYQGPKSVPLREIFSEQDFNEDSGLKYEFVDTEEKYIKEESDEEAFVAAIKKPKDEPPRTVSTVQEVSFPYYTIQALSSKNKEMTEKVLVKMKFKGFSEAYMVTKDLNGRGKWYRIYVGKFKDKKKADEQFKSVRSKYKDCFIRLIEK